MLDADGKVDMNAGGNPIKFPMDVTAALSMNTTTANAGSSPNSSASAGGSSPSGSASSSAPSASQTNGAASKAASTALLGLGLVAAAFLAL